MNFIHGFIGVFNSEASGEAAAMSLAIFFPFIILFGYAAYRENR